LIEQRTGRVDRLGSKTQRERKLRLKKKNMVNETDLPGLEIRLPYLAATYDERMFDCLYKTQRINTPGDVSIDSRALWSFGVRKKPNIEYRMKNG
jgi:hypothetical protein